MWQNRLCVYVNGKEARVPHHITKAHLRGLSSNRLGGGRTVFANPWSSPCTPHTSPGFWRRAGGGPPRRTPEPGSHIPPPNSRAGGLFVSADNHACAGGPVTPHPSWANSWVFFSKPDGHPPAGRRRRGSPPPTGGVGTPRGPGWRGARLRLPGPEGKANESRGGRLNASQSARRTDG